MRVSAVCVHAHDDVARIQPEVLFAAALVSPERRNVISNDYISVFVCKGETEKMERDF